MKGSGKNKISVLEIYETKLMIKNFLILLVNFRDASMCLNIKSILSSFVKVLECLTFVYPTL